ncbi:MAG: tRNA (adenosine(37)-N6)-threonylcarbamoyltransferase complex transferase subunit TsaD [Oscillospiraceae bacterium]|nr:tRNA (adenosine(37)-N6)-threonylcarbamoyltransferase complex transferase subunit TsaD [Oscillospiraceae bacterium]
MNILAIESSCDETAAAVVADGRRIISSVVLSQIDIHKKYGGVVPEIASRAHTEAVSGLVSDALEQAGATFADIEAVAATAQPGLIGALLVGMNFGKALAYSAGKPFIPVNHIRGHIAASYLAFPSLEPPFLALVLSGGHTSMIKVADYTRFEVIGHTRDDAAGEAFDKVARVMGMPYPGGKEMDSAASLGTPGKYSFPSPAVKDSPFEFSFSGLKTAVINRLNNDAQRKIPIQVPDIARSFTDSVVSALVSRSENAFRYTGCGTLVLCGGVSANSHIRSAFASLAQRKGLRLCVPPVSLCGDNAAMIGAQAYYEFLAGNVGSISSNASADAEI